MRKRPYTCVELEFIRQKLIEIFIVSTKTNGQIHFLKSQFLQIRIFLYNQTVNWEKNNSSKKK